MRMYLKPISFWTTASCSCQSARNPSLARPAAMHSLNTWLMRPLTWVKSARMVRGGPDWAGSGRVKASQRMGRHAILIMDCKNTTHPEDMRQPLLLVHCRDKSLSARYAAQGERERHKIA